MDVNKIDSDWKANKFAASHEYHFLNMKQKNLQPDFDSWNVENVLIF